MLINGYSQQIAHKTLISQDQKNRIQELLSQMFNAITPRTEIDSPVYAWFPEGESTTEMEAISIDDSDTADRAVAQVMVETQTSNWKLPLRYLPHHCATSRAWSVN